MHCCDRKSLCWTELGFEGRVTNAVLGLEESVCDLAEQSWDAGAVMKALLGLKESVCDLAGQSWALKAEL